MGEQPENTRLAPHEAWKVRQVVDALLSQATPIREINALMAQAGSPSSSAFERYAGLVLRDAGAERLAGLPPSCAILLTPPGEALLARLTSTTELDAAQQELVTNVENAINRLCCIADAIEDSGRERSPAPGAIAISRMGGGFLADRAGYRSANVRLPAIGRSEQPAVSYFNEVDWRVLDHVATTSHPVFQASLLPNMHQAIMGAYGPDGSDWDVRTRLAALLEALELPLRFSYRFDVNVPRQAVQIAFTTPPAEAFPARAPDPATGALADVSERIERARAVFAMRLSCLLAAAAFGSGRKIERAEIIGLRHDGAQPAFMCAFERKRYVHDTLTAIDAGKLSDPLVRFDIAEVARIMAPERLDLAPLGNDGREGPSMTGMAQTRVAPHLDTRALPDELRKLFHAKRICDIDTRHYHGPGAQAVTDARADSDESAISAIAHLERVVAELERDAAPPDDNAGARPLYCANPLARAVVSLLDDDFAVGAQAEAFLRGDAEGMNGLQGAPSYFRAPDALYHAHMGLSDLYERLGDIPGSEGQADRCIELAPTSATAYFRKADVLAQQSRYHEAANVLLAGLRYAVSRRDCALLYYHLALILWNTGRKSEAVAVHVYTAALAGEYAERSQRVVSNLRKRGDSPVIAYASPLAAAREMARACIPVSPGDAARLLVVKAAIGLSCADAPEACAPYAAEVASYFRDDRILAAACRSIVFGITRDTAQAV